MYGTRILWSSACMGLLYSKHIQHRICRLGSLLSFLCQPLPVIGPAQGFVLYPSQGQKFSKNLNIHSRNLRFLSTKLKESKWILLNIYIYHIKLYGENFQEWVNSKPDNSVITCLIMDYWRQDTQSTEDV